MQGEALNFSQGQGHKNHFLAKKTLFLFSKEYFS